MMSTIEIAEAVQDYVASLYEGLFSAVPLLIVGLVIFAVGMTILAHALTKKLHPMEASTRIIVRILTGLALVAACVFACFDVPNHGGIIGIAVLIAASVAAIFGLVKGARWTKYVIVGIVWLYLAPFEITCVAGALSDRNLIRTFAPISQLGVFATDNYVIHHAVAATLLAVVLSFAVLLLLRDNRQPAQRIAADLGFEIETDKIIGIIAAIVIIVFAIPAFMHGDLSGYLTEGTASVSNAYVERLNEYLNDSSVNEDAAWMSPFTAASNELYEVDARFLNINPEALRRSNLVLYILYSEASFKQMEAIETIHASVSAGESVDEDALATFNSSIEDQTDALIAQVSTIGVGGFFDAAPRIAYDSAFFYMRQIGLVPFGWGLIVCGVLCGAAGVLILRHKPRAESVSADVAAPAMENVPVEYDVVAGPVSKDDKVTEFKPAVKIAIGIAAALVVGGYFVVTEVLPTIEETNEQENSTAFIDEVQATVATRPVELTLWLREAQKTDTSELTSEYLQTGIDLVDAQLAGLKTLTSWDELPEGSEDFAALFAQLAANERPILEEMRGVLASGEIPSQELQNEYAKLRAGEAGNQLEESLEAFLIRYSIENALGLALDD